MLENLEVFRQAQAFASHAGARQEAIARNVANADTPGYRPTDVAPFAEAYRTAGEGTALRRTRPGHLGAEGGAGTMTDVVARPVAGAGAPNGNGVSLEAEMMKAAEARQQHDLALAIYQNALGILRTGLGRAR